MKYTQFTLATLIFVTTFSALSTEKPQSPWTKEYWKRLDSGVTVNAQEVLMQETCIPPIFSQLDNANLRRLAETTKMWHSMAQKELETRKIDNLKRNIAQIAATKNPWPRFSDNKFGPKFPNELFVGPKLTNKSFGTGVLANRRQLNITNSNIKIIPANAFRGLENMELMRLTNNGLENIDPKAFIDLKKIAFLDLSNNNLKELQPKIFENLPKLKVVKVKNNPLNEESKKILKTFGEKNGITFIF